MKVTTRESTLSHGRAFMLVPLLVAMLVAALPATAHGDPLAKPASAIAREHLTAGNQLYRLREFEKAVEQYKTGAINEAAPVFHYNLAQCYRELGRYEEAIWHFERFLDRGQPTGAIEDSVNDFLVEMKGKLQSAMPPGANVPRPPPLYARPEGRQMPPRRKAAIGLGAGGIAAIGLGLGLGLGIRARRFEDDAAKVCPMMVCTSAVEANALIERGKTNAMYANLALGIGAAAAIGVVVFWLTGTPSREPARAAILPGLPGSDTHAGLTAMGWF